MKNRKIVTFAVLLAASSALLAQSSGMYSSSMDSEVSAQRRKRRRRHRLNTCPLSHLLVTRPSPRLGSAWASLPSASSSQ